MSTRKKPQEQPQEQEQVESTDRIKWIKPNDTEIVTNNSAAAVAYAEANNWERVS